MISVLMSFVLLFGSILQEVQYGYNKGGAHTFSFIGQNGGAFTPCPTNGTSICTLALGTNTVAGHIIIFTGLWDAALSTDTNHMTSVYTCNAGSGDCTAGNAIDTLTIVSSSLLNGAATVACGSGGGTPNVGEIAWLAQGAGGANRVTMTTVSNMLPGTCGSSGFSNIALDEFSVSANGATVATDGTAPSIAIAGCQNCTLSLTLTSITGTSDLIFLGNGSIQNSTVSPSPWLKTNATGADGYYALNVGSSVANPISAQSNSSGGGVYPIIVLK